MRNCEPDSHGLSWKYNESISTTPACPHHFVKRCRRATPSQSRERDWKAAPNLFVCNLAFRLTRLCALFYVGEAYDPNAHVLTNVTSERPTYCRYITVVELVLLYGSYSTVARASANTPFAHVSKCARIRDD